MTSDEVGFVYVTLTNDRAELLLAAVNHLADGLLVASQNTHSTIYEFATEQTRAMLGGITEDIGAALEKASRK